MNNSSKYTLFTEPGTDKRERFYDQQNVRYHVWKHGIFCRFWEKDAGQKFATLIIMLPIALVAIGIAYLFDRRAEKKRNELEKYGV